MIPVSELCDDPYWFQYVVLTAVVSAVPFREGCNQTGVEKENLPSRSFLALLIDQRRNVKPLDRPLFLDCQVTKPEARQKNPTQKGTSSHFHGFLLCFVQMSTSPANFSSLVHKRQKI